MNMPENTTTAAPCYSVRGGGVAEYPPASSFGPRHLHDYEFVWMVHGNAVWKVDSQRIEAPAGSIFLCRPGQRDRIAWDPKRGSRHGFLHFSIHPSADDACWPLLRHPGEDDVLHHLLRHALWLHRNGPPLHDQLQSALGLALECFLRGTWHEAGLQQPAADHPVLARVFAFVQQIWRSDVLLPLSLRQLATAAEVSSNQLIRIFKQEYGTTPQEALRLIRLQRAGDLLACGSDGVREIAERCGFASQEHFSRRFRAVYGQSPRAYRQHILGGGDAPVIALVHLRRLARELV